MVLDEAGEVVKEIYVKTDGRPVEVVNKGLADIWNEMGPRLDILGVATTGSGRELIGELIGADTVNDEITAHKTGATFIGRKLIDRVPDTIFEIGGQDSKFISLQDGVVVDFAMNEACAAGTGSFLEEQAEKLGINIIGEFAELALSSEAPVRLGERCTVFMERDVNSYLQRGADKKDLVAGLAYSIAYNYLNRLVGRTPHRRHHLLPGRHRLQRLGGGRLQHDPGQGHHRAAAQRGGRRHRRGAAGPREDGGHAARPPASAAGTWSKVDYTIREFTCKGCTNECDIRQFTIGDEKTYWGDKCSDRYRKRAKVDKEPVIRDLVEFRDALMFSYVTEAEDTRRAAAQRHRRSPRAPWASPGPCTPTIACPSGRPSSRAAGSTSWCRARPTRRSARWASRARWPSPASPSGWRTGTWPSCCEAGRRPHLPAQPAERRDRPSRDRVARLPLGPDPAPRHPLRAALRGLRPTASSRPRSTSAGAPSTSARPCARP